MNQATTKVLVVARFIERISKLEKYSILQLINYHVLKSILLPARNIIFSLKPEGNIHLDHICPCAQAQNEEELIKLQHYSNFQWLPAEDNLKKYDSKTPDAEQKCIELLNREWIE